MTGDYDVIISAGDNILNLTVPKSGTWRDFKNAVENLYGYPSEQQRYGGNIGSLLDDGILEDNFPLSSLGFESGDPVILLSDAPFNGIADSDVPAEVIEESRRLAQHSEHQNRNPKTGVRGPSHHGIQSDQDYVYISDSDDHDQIGQNDYGVQENDDISATFEGERKPPRHPLHSNYEQPNNTNQVSGTMTPFGVMGNGQDLFSQMNNLMTSMNEFSGISHNSGFNNPSAPQYAGRRRVPTTGNTSDPFGNFDVFQSLAPTSSDPFFNGSNFHQQRSVSPMNDLGNIPFSAGDGVKFVTGSNKNAVMDLLTSTCVSPDQWSTVFPFLEECPTHYPGALFSDCLEEARERKCCIVLHVFDTTPETAMFYNMSVAHNSVQSEYLASFLAYFVCVNAAENSALSRTFSTKRLQVPYVLVIASTSSKLIASEPILSGVTTDEFIANLIDLRIKFTPFVEDEAASQAERNASKTLLDEQDDEFLQAEAADRAKADQERVEEQIQNQEAQRLAMESQSKKQYEEDMEMMLSRMKKDQRRLYLKEYEQLPPENANDTKTLIAIRLKDGSKIQRKWNPSTTTLLNLFTFAAGEIAKRRTDDNFVCDFDPKQVFNINRYQLNAQFPNREFKIDVDGNKTLSEVGLVKQELLNLVEKS